MTGKVRPTAQVAPFVEVLGQEKAIEFLMHFGGAEILLTENPKPTGRVAQFIGVGRAAALAKAMWQQPKMRVPLAKRWIAAVWNEDGLPVDEIARRLMVSNVAVRGWLKNPDAQPGRKPGRKRKRDDRQLRLF